MGINTGTRKHLSLSRQTIIAAGGYVQELQLDSRSIIRTAGGYVQQLELLELIDNHGSQSIYVETTTTVDQPQAETRVFKTAHPFE